ncbi:MAG TPA: IS1 family transposase [Cyclobacteriaceae bacterium]|jgi:insertion element IS1 protein InsB|nr:IS1 family transposase [Cytophagales bacterium]HRE65887.1 IS1 family transposase [Cyclobacteriaceae bacterium]HRF33731.1 IS1 family transposase [Cyclobacteriaceae bacterium]
MIESQPCCRHCKKQCVKNGRSKSGAQRYYCKPCKKYFQLNYVYNACRYNTGRWIVSLTIESCGIRSIARLLKIAVATVVRRIKKISKTIQRPFFILKGKEYELDEMRTYIGNKGRLYWIVYALCKDTKKVIDFKIGRRTAKTLQRVTDTLLLSEAKKIYTDGYALYQNLIPKEIHCRSSYRTNHIERKNLTIRTHLKRLSRKTICFSKSREMLEACLKIYFWKRDFANNIS